MKYQYCPVCGAIDELELDKCRYCKSQLIRTDVECDMFDYWDNIEEINKMLYKKYNIANNPKYDLKAVQKRLDDEKENLSLAHSSATDPTLRGNNLVSCPYCKSTNVRKIGMVSRGVSVGLFGLASKKIGKQWHCNQCRSDF